MPTDRRTSASGTGSGVPATEAWVMTAGTSISDSDAAERSASVKSRDFVHRGSRARGRLVQHLARSRHERDHAAAPGIGDALEVVA